MRVRRFLVIAAVVFSLPVTLTSPAAAQGPQINPPAQPPSPMPPIDPPPRPPSQLFSAPPAQGCQTQWGICRVACCIAPGTPCYCQGPNNTALPGYAVEFFRPTQ